MESFDYAFWCGRLSACVESLLDADTEHDKRVVTQVAKATIAEFQTEARKAGIA
jgi:hypothetical protein